MFSEFTKYQYCNDTLSKYRNNPGIHELFVITRENKAFQVTLSVINQRCTYTRAHAHTHNDCLRD